jgi:hypothetical protein
MNKVIFWHTYLVNDYKVIVQDQMTKLFTSGLYDECEMIYVGINYHNIDEVDWFKSLLLNYSKFKVIVHPTNDGEFDTIKLLTNYCKNNNCYVMYFHTKGVGNKEFDVNSTLWRMSMDYNIIYRFKECVRKLDNGVDAVGCNVRYNTHVGYHPHFSGNYWWTTSDHIKTLNNEYLYNKTLLGTDLYEGKHNLLLVEFYIGSNHNCKLESIFECKGTDAYLTECLINEYIN